MNRRKFLKNTLGAGAAVSSGVFGSMLAGMSSAQAGHIAGGAARPTLVVIFQRGGCDGLNTVVPYADNEYYNLRTTTAIAQPEANPDPNNPAVNASLAINDVARGHNNFFGLNPSMSALQDIYNAGDLAVLPAVQYPNSSHSHFSGQDFIEGGDPSAITDGWLYRHLDLQGALGGIEGLSFGNSLAKALRGQSVVQSLRYLRDFGFSSGAGDIITRLNNSVLPLYQQAAIPNVTSPSEILVNNTGQIMFGNLSALSNIDTVNYQPSNNAAYPNTGYGRRLRETAQLIKDPNINVEVVTVNLGGFDTHSNQGAGGGNQSRRLGEFSEGIGALYKDLGARMNDVIILTVTEFGRTAKENGSGGTDHGDASSWFVIGKQIQGGIHGGAWPGLTSNDLIRGRYLNFNLDYRDVFGDILVNHLGHPLTDLPTLLPSHTYSSVGLFA